MSGASRAVIWLGLIMIALNLAMKWADVRNVIFGSPPTTSSTTVPKQVPTAQPHITVM